MWRRLRLAGFLLVALLGLAGTLAPAQEEESTRAPVLVLEVSGVIGPASTDFILRGLERAQTEGAPLVVLRIDTPGGLDTSMREIIRAMLASRVPVAVWVAPEGARAASAGTYILYASHVAAMAPATNLGAATPVRMGGGGLPGMPDEPDRPPSLPETPESGEGEGDGGEGEGTAKGSEETKEVVDSATAMERKIVNDAVAYIRGLALERGRNAEWAERAVREGVSLTAEDAVEAGVADLIARDLRELLRAVDGREIQIGSQALALEVADAPTEVIEPDLRSRLLAIITNPNVAYVLMMLGVYGLFFELANPGSIVPGVAGAICLLLALYSFHVLPVNYAGLALILLGLAFMVGEAFVPSFGALGIGGAIAFVIGSLILMETEVEAYELSLPLIGAVAVVSVGFVLGVITMALRQRRRAVATGSEEMIGSTAEALDAFDDEGRVWVHGEAWAARTGAPVTKGQRVRVRAIDGLVLDVEPVSGED